MAVELELDGEVYEFDDENVMRAFLDKRKQGKAAPEKTASHKFFTKLAEPQEGALGDIEEFLKPLIDPSRAFSSGAARGYTGGLSDLLHEGAAYAGSKLRGEPGTFKDVREARREFDEAQREEYPVLTTAGEIVGTITPGSVFGRTMQLAGKAPLLSKLIGSEKLIPKLLGLAGRGELTSAVTSATSPDVEYTPGVGAAFDAGTYGLLRGARGGYEGTKKIGKGIGKFLTKTLPEKIPFNVGKSVKDIRAGRFGSKIGDIAKEAGASDVQVAGREAAEKIGTVKSGVLKSYNELTRKVLGRFGGEKVSAENLRKGIMRELESLGAVDAKGNIIDNSIITKFDPELKTVVMRLSEFSDELAGNPSLADMDRVVKGIGKLAKFDARDRGTKDLIFGSLFNDARKSFLEGIDDVVTRFGEKSPAYKGAVKKAGVLEGQVAELNEKAARVQKPKGWAQRLGLQKVQKELPATRQQLEEANKLIEQLDFENATSGKDVKEVIQAARKVISQNLDVAEGPLGKLADKLPEEVVTKARGTGKLNLGSVVDEALAANESYRDPIRQIIMGDIVESGKDPAKLKKVLEVYEKVIPKVLEPKDIDILRKLAGTYVKPGGPVGEGASWLIKKLQGGQVKPDVIERLSRTPITSLNQEAP